MNEIEPIVIVRETPATPARAWSALTEPEIVERWFTVAVPIVGIGSAYRLDFGDSAASGIVTELVPGRRFAYTWSWEDAEPRQETLVSWEIEPLDEGCRVTLRHEGWTAAGADEHARDDHARYWDGYLDDLADLLSNGAGAAS